jgi:hypothetical protein
LAARRTLPGPDHRLTARQGKQFIAAQGTLGIQKSTVHLCAQNPNTTELAKITVIWR